MTIDDIRAICYGEQKVIVWMCYGSARQDRIVYVGKFKGMDKDVLKLWVGHMYTRDDGFLSISVPVQ